MSEKLDLLQFGISGLMGSLSSLVMSTHLLKTKVFLCITTTLLSHRTNGQ